MTRTFKLTSVHPLLWAITIAMLLFPMAAQAGNPAEEPAAQAPMQDAMEQGTVDEGMPEMAETMAAPEMQKKEASKPSAIVTQTKYVNTPGLNVRSGAGSSHPVQKVIYRGEKVEAFANAGEWTRISEDGTTPEQWVFTRLLSDKQVKSRTAPQETLMSAKVASADAMETDTQGAVMPDPVEEAEIE